MNTTIRKNTEKGSGYFHFARTRTPWTMPIPADSIVPHFRNAVAGLTAPGAIGTLLAVHAASVANPQPTNTAIAAIKKPMMRTDAIWDLWLTVPPKGSSIIPRTALARGIERPN